MASTKKQPAQRRSAKTPAKKAKAPARKRPAKKATPAKRDVGRVTRGELLHIPLERIKPDPGNERKQLTGIDELAATMGDGVGIIESITVGPEDADGKYPLVFGHRRLAAAKKARLRTAPCIVRDLDEEARTETRLIENLHREDLSPVEEADGYTKLVALGWTQRRMSERLGRSQSHISKRLSLLALPEPALDALDSRRITIDDAEHLTKLKDHPDRIVDILDDDDDLSVDWCVKEHLRELGIEKVIAELTTQHRAKGTPMVTPDEVAKIDARAVNNWGGVDVDKREHAKEPCHAVVIRRALAGADAEVVCTEPWRHDDNGPSDLKAKRQGPELVGGSETAKAEKRARREATKARHEFVAALLDGRLDRTEVLDLTARAFLERVLDYTARKRIGKLLGVEPPAEDDSTTWHDTIDTYVAANEQNLLRVCVAAMFDRAEDNYAPPAQRRVMYQFLLGRGYAPGAIEKADIAELDMGDGEPLGLFTDEDQRLEPGDEVQDDGSILHEDGTVTPADQVGPKDAATSSWPDLPPLPNQQTIDDSELATGQDDEDGFFDAMRQKIAAGDEPAGATT